MPGQGRGLRCMAKLNVYLAIIAVLIFPIASLGTQFEFWTYVTGLTWLRYGVYLGIVAIGIAVILFIAACIKQARGTRTFALISIIIALVVVVPVGYLAHIARTVPPINDITTDWINPPQFVYSIPGRGPENSPLDYPGEVFAAEQRAAYPEITTLSTRLSEQAAFEGALALAESLDWQIIDFDQSQGIIEATVTSFWFGFKDDVVIRITATETGSDLDMRSVSRVGRSDLGVNAKRISDFLQRFSAEFVE